MRFRVVRTAPDDSQVPRRLAEIEPLIPSGGAARRTFEFSRRTGSDGHRVWVINGKSFDPETALANSPRNEVEIWRFVTNVHHPVHVHLDSFQVLQRGSSGPGPFDLGWKDTIDLPPGQIADVAVRFNDYAGRFLMHCHNLEHEDMAMMATIRTH